MKKKKKISTGKIIAYIFLAILCFLFIVPILWAVLSSFKNNQEVIRTGFTFFPKHWTVENFVTILSNTTSIPMLRWFFNSVVISVTHTGLTVIVASLAAYGYSRLNFKGRDTLFITLILLSMIPAVVNIIPLYFIVDKFNWVDTPLSCIVPGLSGVSNIFLIRQFMFGIPKDIDEAARIDGAGHFKIYTNIMIPALKPVLTVVALFTFTTSWNDFLWPSIVFNDVQHMTVSSGLQLLQGMYSYLQSGTLLAGAVFALIPTFIIYMFTQKYFIKTMSFAAAVKG